MANNPIIKIKRGATAPATGALAQGEFAVDQVSKNLYLGISDGNGGTINEIVGGSGTFATKQFVTDAVSAGTGSLGTMSTQNADSVAITGGAIDGTAIGATTPSTGKFTGIESTDVTATNTFSGPTHFAYGISGVPGNPLYVASTIDLSIGSGKIEGLTVDPTNDNDAARKKYVDDAVAAGVSALGSVFRFVGDLSSEVTGNALETLSDQNTGAYYRVDVAGTYTSGADSFAAKVGDAFVKTSTGWQKLDNVDAEVFGTANEIVVTGDENAGYAVALDSAFKNRVWDVENRTQNIDPEANAVGTTQIGGKLAVSSISIFPPEFIVGTVNGVSEPESIIYAEGNTYNVSLGVYYGGETKIRSTKLVGATGSGSNDMPTLENFVIDGGEY